MVVEEIIESIQELTAEDRQRIALELTRLRLEEDGDFWTDVDDKLKDKSPESWVNVRDL